MIDFFGSGAYDGSRVWAVIVALGIGTFLVRFSFLGIVGDRQLPAWVLRHLRYTAVAVIPALVAPLVFFPAQTGGQTDPIRLIAAAATLLTGWRTKNMLLSIICGMGTLYLLRAVFGAG